ncbi:MAG: hypothetical protein IKN04_03875 [Clostridia bacterium]|nr:hypothetical protein [Clostridia bacterium]
MPRFARTQTAEIAENARFSALAEKYFTLHCHPPIFPVSTGARPQGNAPGPGGKGAKENEKEKIFQIRCHLLKSPVSTSERTKQGKQTRQGLHKWNGTMIRFLTGKEVLSSIETESS